MNEEIIDSHIHPPLADGTISTWFPGRASVVSGEDFVAHLKQAGVKRACGACIGPMPGDSFAPIAEANRSALTFRDRFGDFYIPAVQLDLRLGQESCGELDHYYHNEGVRWIGELVLYQAGGEDDYTSKGAFEVYALAQQLGMPVNFHCNKLHLIPQMCEGFDRLNFVLAHPKSDKAQFLQRLELVRKYPNLYMDLSGSGLQRYGLLRHAIDTAGEHKFLFGSDFPICGAAGFVADVRSEQLTPRQQELVFAGNFKRLTGLG
ncbi:MAG: amidohydrolase [Phycisphaerae bacterium]|nr:amidohydrolase [Phycisphaerae bacterium]